MYFLNSPYKTNFREFQLHEGKPYVSQLPDTEILELVGSLSFQEYFDRSGSISKSFADCRTRTVDDAYNMVISYCTNKDRLSRDIDDAIRKGDYARGIYHLQTADFVTSPLFTKREFVIYLKRYLTKYKKYLQNCPKITAEVFGVR